MKKNTSCLEIVPYGYFKEKAWQKFKKILSSIYDLVFISFLFYTFVSGSFYYCRSDQQAIVMRMGKIIAVNGEGLHFKIPIIDERIIFLKGPFYMRINYGVYGLEESNNNEIAFISNKHNKKNIAIYIEWEVTDAQKVLGIDSVSGILNNAFYSTLNNTLGKDEVTFLEEFNKLNIEMVSHINQQLEEWNVGIKVNGIEYIQLEEEIIA